MANLRLWHQSRDPYHASFRMLQLLAAREDTECNLKKLYILDFFILFPSLLHKVSMTQELRSELTELKITKPEKEFLEYPSLPTLFRSIYEYQKLAVKRMTAKGLINPDEVREGFASLNPDALNGELRDFIEAKIEEKAGLLKLVANGLGNLPLEGVTGLYQRTNLPRRI